MAQRLRFYDLRYSAMPELIGKCQDNARDLAEIVNSAQRRLLYAKEAGDEGWWGTWAEIAFQVSQSKPCITLPREVARLEALNVCDCPVLVQNQFFEYLQFGNGRLPKQCSTWNNWGRLNQAYTRNNAITFVDLTNPPQFIRVYATNPADMSSPSVARIFLQGKDSSNNTIYSQDGFYRVQGEFFNFEDPFAQTPYTINQLTGIQKDVTSGPIRIAQVDPTTGDEIDLLTMEPGELVAGYRRYYLDSLPCFCGPGTPGTLCPPSLPAMLTVRAIAKLELIPVSVDTDYLLIQNKEAMILACQSVAYSRSDTPAAKLMARDYHQQAIQMLNGELNHYLGIKEPAIQFAPFGSARLSRQQIGSLM